KNPDLRFPSCLDFVRALRAPQPREAPSITEPVSGTADATSVAADAPLSEQCSSLSNSVPSRPEDLEKTTPEMKRRRRRRTADTKQSAGQTTPKAGSRTSSPAVSAPASTAPGTEARGILVPVVIIGLGRLGLKSLREFRRLLSEQFGVTAAAPHVRLLYVD